MRLFPVSQTENCHERRVEARVAQLLKNIALDAMNGPMHELSELWKTLRWSPNQ